MQDPSELIEDAKEQKERKHVIEEVASPDIAALLTSPACLHPDLPLRDPTEREEWAELSAALAKGEWENRVYALWRVKLEANSLSLAAQYRFANMCYRLWRDQLPSVAVWEEHQAHIRGQKARLASWGG